MTLLKSINKTQFKMIYRWYNNNIYNETLTNFREVDQGFGLVEKFPSVFSIKRHDYRNYTMSISNLNPLLTIIKYNEKFEREL